MPTHSPSKGLSAIPNLFTLLNLVFGCIAIIFILQEGVGILATTDNDPLVYMPEQIWMASLFIGLAGVVDFLDGFVARLFRASSEMGKQLDSLADVVSFGVAPGLIIYQFLRLSFAQGENGLNTPMIWLAPAFILPAAAAWRLAKFNLDPGQAFGFKGIPTPAMGLLVASLPLIYWNVNEEWVRELLLNKWFLYGFVLVLSFLMVSNIPMLGFKFKDYGVKNNLPRYILLILAVVSILLLKWLAVPVIFVAYVLVSLAFKNKIA